MITKRTDIVQTEFLEGQGLGNQLWVYASGKAVARTLDRPHVCTGLARFKGNAFLEILSDHDPAPELPVDRFHEKIFYDQELAFFSSTFDKRVYTAGDRVQLTGLYQSERYLCGHMTQLRDWIKPSTMVTNKALKYRDTCVINIRGGEYKRHKRLILPDDYWASALRVMREHQEFNDVLVVSDDVAYAKLMFPSLPVLNGSVEDCYAALLGAKCAILSNSSFAYFPIKTRHDKPFVIAPEKWARYADNIGRWAMPCNCYEDWNYLPPNGMLRSYRDCIGDAEADAKYYESEFNICLPNNTTIGSFKTRFVPQVIKKSMRRLLTKLLPKYF